MPDSGSGPRRRQQCRVGIAQRFPGARTSGLSPCARAPLVASRPTSTRTASFMFAEGRGGAGPRAFGCKGLAGMAVAGIAGCLVQSAVWGVPRGGEASWANERVEARITRFTPVVCPFARLAACSPPSLGSCMQTTGGAGGAAGVGGIPLPPAAASPAAFLPCAAARQCQRLPFLQRASTHWLKRHAGYAGNAGQQPQPGSAAGATCRSQADAARLHAMHPAAPSWRPRPASLSLSCSSGTRLRRRRSSPRGRADAVVDGHLQRRGRGAEAGRAAGTGGRRRDGQAWGTHSKAAWQQGRAESTPPHSPPPLAAARTVAVTSAPPMEMG